MTVSLSRQFVDPAIASEPKEDWKPLENLVTLYCYDYQFHWPFPDESGQEGQRHNDEPGGDQIQAESKFCIAGTLNDAHGDWHLVRHAHHDNTHDGIRMERQQANAAKLAEWLKANPKVKRVYYPGFENHPGHNIMKKQARGFGSMISFEMESKESAVKVLNSVKLISFAESLGGVETLLTYPTLQTHPDVPAEVKERNGITESLLRLSVGIEDIEDLIADLEKAFA